MTNNAAYRYGFCDALFYRPCKSPYPAHWKHIRKSALYLDGYMKGVISREKFNIKPIEGYNDETAR
jgi:hypothetical protein